LPVRDLLFEPLPGSSGAGLAIDSAGSVCKRNLGVSSPLVGAVVEINGLRDGLSAGLEPRGRRWRGREIDKSRALGGVGVVTLVFPNSVASAPLTDSKWGYKDNVLQDVINLRDFPQHIDMFAGWVGLTPDDAPLLMRDRSIQEIYALDLHFN
jgi:hypothetical protein